MFPGNPYHPTYTPNLTDVGPMMMPNVPAVSGHIQLAIRQYATRENIEVFYYAGVLTQNNFCNPDFDNVVALAVDFMDYLIVLEGKQFNAILQKVVTDMLFINAAIYASRIPQITQQFTQQDGERVNANLRLFNDIQVCMQRYTQYLMSQRPQQQQSFGNGYPPPQTGYQTQGYGNGYSQPQQVNNQYQQPQGNSYRTVHTLPASNRGQTMSNFASGNAYTANPEPQQVNRGLSMWRPEEPPKNAFENTGPMPDHLRQHVSSAPTVEQMRQEARQRQSEIVKRADEIDWNWRPDDTPVPPQPKMKTLMIRPKRFCKCKGCFLKDGTRRQTAVDPTKEIALVVVENNEEISEVILPLGESPVKYEVHETANYFDPIHPGFKNTPTDMEKVNKSLEDYAAQKKVEDHLAESDMQLTADDIKSESEYTTLDITNQCLIGSYRGDYHSPMLGYQRQTGDVIDYSKQIVNYTLTDMYDWPLTDKAREVCEKAIKATKWDQLYGALMLLNKEIPDAYWRTVVNSLTRHVNRIFTTHMGYDLTIDNFTTDILDLPQHFKDNEDVYGESAWDEFNAYCINVAQAVFTPASSIVTGVNEAGEVIETEEFNLATTHNVTLLPIMASDVALSYTGDVGVVNESRLPNLYKAIVRKFETAVRECEYMVFVTIDGAVMYTYQTSSGEILISKEDKH